MLLVWKINKRRLWKQTSVNWVATNIILKVFAAAQNYYFHHKYFSLNNSLQLVTSSGLAWAVLSSSMIRWLEIFYLTRLQVWFSVESCWEGHVVQSTRDSIDATVLLHSLDTIFRLVWGQFSSQLLGQNVGFVCCQDPEAVNNLLGSVHICWFSGHKVQETVKLNISTGIGVNNGENTLEVNFSLLVLTNRVAKGYQTVLKFLGVQTTSSEKYPNWFTVYTI